ncbi:MAG: prepilin-type N-terminal cleavage/methylation domain-containing protein [Bryobacteraceae bacterium]|nr:prepilin-type N-terminal cleavage/methylation domain-containing protein [Bryobacteraceae bacterium]
MKPRSRRRGVTLMEMMLVVLLISLMAALTFPGVSSGLDSIRMRTAADAVAGLLAQAMVQVERRQEPVELTIARDEGVMTVRSLRPGFAREYRMPDGITIERVLPEPPGEPPAVRSLLVFPGATFPRVTLVISSSRGHRRQVRVDPVTGVARVEEAEQAEQE